MKWTRFRGWAGTHTDHNAPDGIYAVVYPMLRLPMVKGPTGYWLQDYSWTAVGGERIGWIGEEPRIPVFALDRTGVCETLAEARAAAEAAISEFQTAREEQQ